MRVHLYNVTLCSQRKVRCVVNAHTYTQTTLADKQIQQALRVQYQHRKISVLLYNKEQAEKEILKTPFTITSKTIKHLAIYLTEVKDLYTKTTKLCLKNYRGSILEFKTRIWLMFSGILELESFKKVYCETNDETAFC